MRLNSNTLQRYRNTERKLTTHIWESGRKGAIDLLLDEVVKKKPTKVSSKYRTFELDSVTGVIYITQNSPQYLSGEMRLRGKSNGQYPYGFKEGIWELFGKCNRSQNEIEVCSGEITKRPNLVTVDVNRSKNPTYVLDAQHLPREWTDRYDRWNCDPPYSKGTAKKMYGTEMPSISRLLAEGARVTRPGGLMFLLLGDVNRQACPKSTIRIGRISMTIVPNQEVRALHCYLKL
jgi:hypothetical protein